jgi:hypothetical protein
MYWARTSSSLVIGIFVSCLNGHSRRMSRIERGLEVRKACDKLVE